MITIKNKKFLCGFRYANITSFDKIDYHYDSTKEFPEGWVEMEVCIDDATYRRYLSSFGVREETKGLKGLSVF